MSGIDRLLEIMAKLRDPDGGCPWDVEQTYRTIAPYTIEEAYEVAEAIEKGDMEGLKDELGDLLLQVVFHSQMATEDGLFGFDTVAHAISDKMLRRHPHVFGSHSYADLDDQTRGWEDIKAAEKAERGETPESVLDGVPAALPGLSRAVKLQKRAARVGFDWGEAGPVFAKIKEEIAELEAAGNADEREDEFGDILFALANLARHLKIDPEAAIRRTNEKFDRRFRAVEQALGERLTEASLDEMEAEWQKAKRL